MLIDLRPYKLVFTLFFLLIILHNNMLSAQDNIELLVRADDMGISHDVNLAIIKAHKEGIVTSASIMPTSAFFWEAVSLCKENPTLATGIHLTLLGYRERPVLSPEEVPSIVNPKGFFYEDSEKLERANPRPEEIENEIRAQIGKVRASGLHFVYLDWHRGVPQIVRNIILKLCREQQLIYGQGMNGSVYGYSHIRLQPASVVVKPVLVEHTSGTGGRGQVRPDRVDLRSPDLGDN
jgi:hypothetical protein